MMRLARVAAALGLMAAVWLTTTSTSTACPFCNAMQGKTFTGEVNDAAMVLYGRLTSANEKKETTEIEIEDVLKDNAVRANQKRMTLHRYVDLSLTTDKDRFLVFCDLYKGKIEPYRGMALKAGSKLPEYVRGAVQKKDKPIGERLKFFFDYLDNSDTEVSTDAYKEFSVADYKDFKAMAKELPADRVVKWLKSSDTPAYRVGLYASMLGHCGKDEHAAVLKGLLDDPERRAGSGVDGVMAAYAMLRPKEGWTYIQTVLKSPKEEFMFRYAALRAVRFFYDYRTDVFDRKQIVEGVTQLLQQDDIADLAIEDLRKWKAWDAADKVLAVSKTAAFKQPIVKRALLRYCLQCQGVTEATAYVADRRKADPKVVEEAEELLKLEQEPATPATPDGTKGAAK
ncbi:MAG: hypothetical protein U0736_24075 [Gemmataceae bacterium]